jgi:hypothetical protein
VHFHLLVSAILALTISSAATFGCACVPAPPNIKTARDLAQWTASRSDIIVEGKVERVDLKWELMEAKAGDVISADVEQVTPVMLVAFIISYSYRGLAPGQKCIFPLSVSLGVIANARPGEAGENCSERKIPHARVRVGFRGACNWKGQSTSVPHLHVAKPGGRITSAEPCKSSAMSLGKIWERTPNSKTELSRTESTGHMFSYVLITR